MEAVTHQREKNKTKQNKKPKCDCYTKLDLWSLAWYLVVNLCICFHQLMHEGSMMLRSKTMNVFVDFAVSYWSNKLNKCEMIAQQAEVIFLSLIPYAGNTGTAHNAGVLNMVLGIWCQIFM
ncbi:hypothetical protein STEG23_000297, partial [Scotinomys teguina]